MEVARDEVAEHPGGCGHGAGPDSPFGILELRVPEHISFLTDRCPVVLDDLDIETGERGSQLPRVADCRRREDEGGTGAVVGRHSPEAPQHVGHMTPEDTAQRVQFVDHHVLQTRQERLPASVIREHADVHHVRIREDDVGVASGPPPIVGLGVAVVDRRNQLVGTEPVQASELVLGERLGREDQERARMPIGGDGLGDGKLVDERLAGSGRRHDDGVVSRSHRPDTALLVAPEPLDPCRPQAFGDEGRRRRVEVGEESGVSGDMLDVGDPLNRLLILMPCGDGRVDRTHARSVPTASDKLPNPVDPGQTRGPCCPSGCPAMWRH